MQNPPGALGEVVRLFLRLGFTAFGGPAAHIAMMHNEVVVRRKWIDEQHFLDLVGATNLVPGPNSTEMVIHLGHLRAGWRGMILAGLCFVLPATLIVGVLAWAYVTYGSTPQGEALMVGIKPVIIAIVLQALIKLGRTALKSALLAAIGVITLALYLLGVNELLLLFGGALLYWLIATLRDRGDLFAVAPLAMLPALSAAVVAAPFRLDRLFWIFLKIGAVLYGSGYVLIAFLRNDLVVRTGWLTDQQLLDAIAVGQFTPGPLFTSATFIGYILGGVPGAILATVGIFLPSFIFVALLTWLVPHLRRSAWTARLLDGVNVAAIGLMGGVLVQIGRAALISLPTILIALAAAAILFRTKINSAWLVLAGGLVGLALRT
jgi:chromate transporter